ncbi:biotin carboxylase [Gordonia crocea]|uniref:Biotin carboxylase n=1 Tax=Gordonia crocea TaxID=589162 RepID=A0A7I9UXR7_9ACTN|nr:biotin carboxylase [Gordonia crocea]
MVAKRHAKGGRTARENVADLVDEDSWVEWGRYAVAGQRMRRSRDELIATTPADGIVAGMGSVDGRATAVLAYDYTVMAGTQGMRGHKKTDRMFDVIERTGVPVVFFAEGGGGRPNDTDFPLVSALDAESFALWASLSGKSPRISIVNGSCFAGNAVIAGCSDFLIATASASIGMAGPAMIAGGGLGEYAAEEIGPVSMQEPNGVVDLVVADEAEATAAARRLLGYFHGPTDDWKAHDQDPLRDAVPESSRTAFDTVPVITRLADRDSVTILRPKFAPEMITALVRIEGRPVGILANNSMHMAGTVTGPGSDKAARFVQLCDSFGIPLVSLLDTPGYMVGPDYERDALVRHCSRLLIAAGAMRVPSIAVILRRAYGLGAQAMCFGSLKAPLITMAWPGATLGAMGPEGAVRLAARKELAAIDDDAEREKRVRELTAMLNESSRSFNAAEVFEVEDIVDPAQTRQAIAHTLAAAGPVTGSGRPVDAW